MTHDDRHRRRALTYFAGTRLVLVSMERLAFPFLPAIARGLDVSLAQAGLLLSARGVGGLMVPLAVAAGGHRGDARRLVTVALLLFTAGALLVVAPAGYAVALVGFAVFGAARLAFDATAQAYLSDLTSYDRRARVLAVLELVYAGALLVGAPIAGWLIATWDWRAPFVVGAVLAAIFSGQAWRSLEAREATGQARGPLRLDRETFAFLALMAGLLTAAELTFVVFGAWLEDVHGFSVIGIGAWVIAIGVAELAGEFVTLAVGDRFGKRRTFLVGCALAVAALITLALASTKLVAGVIAVAFALFAFEVAIVAAIPLGTELRPAGRVRFLALVGMSMSGGRIVAAAAGPWLYEQGGVAANALASAAVFALTGLAMARFVTDR
ncbi:MAG: MFS transporter [Nitriliruptorales bacterium]|nr:MFS transporter [Nitriliruptorales bacterium]